MSILEQKKHQSEIKNYSTTSSVRLTKMRASVRVNLKTLRKMEKAFRILLKPVRKDLLKWLHKLKKMQTGFKSLLFQFFLSFQGEGKPGMCGDVAYFCLDSFVAFLIMEKSKGNK